MSGKDKVLKFKKNLALVFDDDLHTKKWINIVDYLIIVMILISTAEIFLSTFDIDPTLRRVLFWVEIGTLIFFTIEVTLRIWVAPLVDPRFKGWKGRLKYCFTFNGFIDVISTYPFYLQWLIPFPLTWMRAFRMSRTIRLFRLSRYMKSWNLLSSAIREKRRELIISMQFLLIVTFILSLILFFFEHEKQPEVYDNGFTSVMWAFAQYIGDPGGFGDTPPVTVPGKIIACIVGLLGIAIVAVPAGIIGSGFTETIEHELNDEKLRNNRKKMYELFERKLDRPSGYQAVNFFKSFADIQARSGMSENDILETVEQTPGFRIINLASTIPVEAKPVDRLAVEHFAHNRSYGTFIDRGSRVTIITSASVTDAGGGTFGFYVALIGGFNFISREIGPRTIYKSLYVKKPEVEYTESEQEFYKDLERLVDRKDSWSFDIFPASGAQELEYDTKFHFGIGNLKGNESFEGDDILVRDIETYKKFYYGFSKRVEDEFGLTTDNGKYHSTAIRTMWRRVLDVPEDMNAVVLRIAWSALLWNDKRMLIAKALADCINEYILGKKDMEEPAVLKSKAIGFAGYDIPDYNPEKS